ncbi:MULTISPECIES: SoxR reducing system RseC family protein [Vibrio]|uniref:Sigma-E factor negative regulatory protein RseC n=1 Tax=Vibrio proteolyticus NBRC 13287 TaxID=1219065 RepID=U3BH07_VIBPR|nr:MULTISPECIES: SoxR reducing system RseC family protein [Vibrio]NAW60223.1 transcriptional regulator [Vibrio sp. V36_P2S2PM302]NAX21513.1 transcriptional regulator [Vibrio sp. V39_P1S14PM300]NAX28190.1 transcriptional regulator [Vibrio sp. V38_P2S17PM301]NAX28987.1 transcriptional regulator [Vibrio sp. V37_P2S8PM304]GAD68944.1 sigma-E factor negative regulatory protein RseC [Vibrio proteolyticus NBRC 13287]
MMTALATVSSVTSKAKGFEVELSCDQQTSCSSCASQKSCGTGIVSKAVGKKSLHWRLLTSRSVKAGQVVEIGFPEKSLLQSAAIVYLVPLLAMIAGALLAQWLLVPAFGLGEGAVILCSTLSTAGGIWAAKKLSKNLERQSHDEVVLLRVLGEPIS